MKPRPQRWFDGSAGLIEGLGDACTDAVGWTLHYTRKSCMNLRIELTQNPTEEQRQAILQPLIEYNDAKTGISKTEPFALMVKDEHGAILGGLYGRVTLRWMFIDLLSVPEQGRGQGIGSQLMAQAQALAEEKNCYGIWLDTFDFQAPEFYQKLGFSQFGEIVDYPPGHKRHFFQKRLID